MPNVLLALYLISALAVVLGFIALLMQKVYIDSQTNLPTSVEVPALGRIKTNYPALVFVVLGLGLASFVFARSTSVKEVWTITGELHVHIADANDRIMEQLAEGFRWSDGDIVLIPTDMMSSTIEPTGQFTLNVLVESGLSVEDKFDAMQYTGHPLFFGSMNFDDTDALVQSGRRTKHYRFDVQPAKRPRQDFESGDEKP